VSSGKTDDPLRVSIDLMLLAPRFRSAVDAALIDCAARGLDAVVYEGYRSADTQAAYFRRGRTQIPPTKPVTNAQSNLQSWHGYGLAVDVISKAQAWNAGATWFAQVADVFKSHGCSWGGDWTDPDLPHFQWGHCKPSPSDIARQILATQGMPAVWSVVGASDAALVPAADLLGRFNLRPAAHNAATILCARFPQLQITSGRRSIQEQATAMSKNIALDRDFVRSTYKASPVSIACQRWVDSNPGVTNAGSIAAGLLSVFVSFDDAGLARISKHLSGDAFDVQPVVEGAGVIKAFIAQLPSLERFLDHEGNLERWHLQFAS
jgi:hypothetical protein